MIKIATWIIKRGIVKRELEIVELINKEDLDILFLTETDERLNNEEDFKLCGFNNIRPQ